MQVLQTPARSRASGKLPKWLLFAVIGILLAGLIAGGLWAYVVHANEYQVDLTLNGDETITLEYGQTFDEPGAQAVGRGTLLKKEPQALQVTIGGKVDVSKLGTYELTYCSTFEGAEATATRIVYVLDTVAPKINMVSGTDHVTLPNQKCNPLEYTASDNYDGDLTAKVTYREEDGKMIYTVTDTSGNETTEEFPIRYEDPVAPVLTLTGDSNITITEGNRWKDPGYSATDNVDGDLTAQVIISGTVDHNKPGTYKLTYEVKDSYNNSAKAERTITVKAKPKPQTEPQPQPQTPPQSGTEGGGTQEGTTPENLGKVIYLTFDDGPSSHTPRLLDILARYNVKATFFVCGTGKVELLDDIANAGHTLALHTKTHKYENIYSSDSAYFEDLYAIQSIVEQYTGIKSMLMRFPGGSSNTTSKKYSPGIMTRLTQSVQEKGFVYFDWNIDSQDAGGATTTEEVVQNVINGISKKKSKNLVVLQHDIRGYSVDAVEQIIQWGLANGCTFKALSANGPTCHHSVNN